MPILNKILLFCFISMLALPCFGQGDGPRAHLFAPTGVWAINPKFLHLNQNVLPAGNILVQDFDITVDIFPTTLVHSFAIKGRLARVYAMMNPGSFTAKTDILDNNFIKEVHASGFSDGFLAFEIGLIGTPAINALQFSKQGTQFSLMGYFRYWYSGTYDSDKIINLGTNRVTFELAAPMAIPFHKDLKQNATWLEIFPSIQLYTANNDPARGSFTEKVEQDPMLIIESHLTHNFTKKLWVGVETGQNNISADMLRFSLVFACINLKKLNLKTN